jgi:hypothetical protein
LGSHDSGFQKLAKEQKEEEAKKKKQQKAAGQQQKDSQVPGDEEEFMLSQTDSVKENREVDDDKEYGDKEAVDYEDSLESDKRAMEKLDAKFEERTSKLSKFLNFQNKEGDWMEIDMKDMTAKEGETEIELSGDENEAGQFRMVPI